MEYLYGWERLHTAVASLTGRVYEDSVFSRLHAYRMYLQVAALTIEAERKAENLAHAKRVREQLHHMLKQRPLSAHVGGIINEDLARLDEQRAQLCTDVLIEALSLMYRPAAGAVVRPPTNDEAGPREQ
jgi:hypothetical protein